MEIKEIRINNNCLEIICEDRYVTFSLKDINTIEKLIEELQDSKYTLDNLIK